MADLWIGRLYVIAQIVIVIVCAVLIGCGHNSVIMDLFLAAAGGLVLTEGYKKISKN